jgi:hypothetical protein
MKTETLVWTVLFLVGGAILIGNGIMRGAGSAYVKAVPQEFANVGTADDPRWVNVRSDAALDHDIAAVPADARISWTRYDKSSQKAYATATAADPSQTDYRWSLSRTIGIWVAALFTLFILSFLYKDNPLYKIAESVVVGVSAAYWMIVGWWDTIVPNLIGKLSPDLVQSWAMPGLRNTSTEWAYVIPLILGAMLLWRLAPKGGWISRWPMAFIIGVFCGFRLISFLHADFLSQIRNSIAPLWVEDAAGAFTFWGSMRGVVLLIGVLSCLTYFFFSIEHRGVVGGTARLGIWFLMVTFGAAFGYTVMGRIALLAIRLEFLFDDWLWLIDPTGKRMVETAAMLWPSVASVTGLA